MRKHNKYLDQMLWWSVVASRSSEYFSLSSIASSDGRCFRVWCPSPRNLGCLLMACTCGAHGQRLLAISQHTAYPIYIYYLSWPNNCTHMFLPKGRRGQYGRTIQSAYYLMFRIVNSVFYIYLADRLIIWLGLGMFCWRWRDDYGLHLHCCVETK